MGERRRGSGGPSYYFRCVIHSASLPSSDSPQLPPHTGHHTNPKLFLWELAWPVLLNVALALSVETLAHSQN